MTPVISVLPYTSVDKLDRRLAAIGYAAAHGWPDQRPITEDLVASRLAPPPGAPSTVLAVAYTRDDTIVGWGALRPAAPGGNARLWGPIVEPSAQGKGIGGQLLTALVNTDLFRSCQDRLTTAGIPAQRRTAVDFFERAGWHRCGKAALLHVRPIAHVATATHGITVRPATDQDDLADSIAHLYLANNPSHGHHTAGATLERWSMDRRYSPNNLLLARDPTGELAGVALLYPLAHVNDEEPPEMLLADVLLADDTLSDGCLDALVGAALDHAAAANPNSVFRCITTRAALADRLVGHGAELTDQIVYLRPGAPAPAGTADPGGGRDRSQGQAPGAARGTALPRRRVAGVSSAPAGPDDEEDWL